MSVRPAPPTYLSPPHPTPPHPGSSPVFSPCNLRSESYLRTSRTNVSRMFQLSAGQASCPSGRRVRALNGSLQWRNNSGGYAVLRGAQRSPPVPVTCPIGTCRWISSDPLPAASAPVRLSVRPTVSQSVRVCGRDASPRIMTFAPKESSDRSLAGPTRRSLSPMVLHYAGVNPWRARRVGAWGGEHRMQPRNAR